MVRRACEGVRNPHGQARGAGEQGVDIAVGAVNVLRVSDVRVAFERGPVASVSVSEVTYTGRVVTLFAWGTEFLGKRIQGVKLRDRLPAQAPGDDGDDGDRDGGDEGNDGVLR